MKYVDAGLQLPQDAQLLRGKLQGMAQLVLTDLLWRTGMLEDNELRFGLG
jgi:hypothetical protein